MKELRCKQCKIRKAIKIFCSQRCYWDSLKGIKNGKAPHWKENVGYVAVHIWLNVNYGKPQICENPNCKGKSKKYDWAKKTDAEYVRDRSAFLRLCRSCHIQYDRTPEKDVQKSKHLWQNKGEPCPAIKREIIQLDKSGEKIQEWQSLSKAARILDILVTSIANCLAGRSRTAGGYVWQYK